jgi:hypothetical protein
MLKKGLTVIFLFVLLITASVFGQSSPRRSRAPKKREVWIYVLRSDDGNPSGLVAVKRKVRAGYVLQDTFKALAIGATENEEDTGLTSFIAFEFVSVKLNGRTARIDFKSGEEFGWGEPMRTFFAEAVEKTARQFPEIKRVRICVDGIEDYWRIDAVKHKKCRE